MAKEITTRENNYPQWYNDLVLRSGLAENSSVRGCMVIKPYGYALWENMQANLDKMFKETGHQNAYFPIFIPKSFLNKEAQHIEGFAKECAVVTHYRLKNSPDGKGIIVDPEAKLEEELIVRPTSETIIWSTFKNWVQSYRDLPLLINQWANVVRWELRTRLFLRTSEFLWQEGHTAHATKEEAMEEAEKMMNIYTDFLQNYLAIPVYQGKKTESEKFPGADITYCVEALMQDGKALQAGTSHFLGQNFSKAFEVKFTDKDGKENFVWATSWGSSTRLIGGLIMSHSDDEGLVIPPKIAPIQVVIIPIYFSEVELERINQLVKNIEIILKKLNISFKYDNSINARPGWKFAEYELKGIPIRITLGKKEIEQNVIEIFRRDTKMKFKIGVDEVEAKIPELLNDIQNNIFENAKKRLIENTYNVSNYDEFKKVLENKGGFIEAFWDGTPETEAKIKNETQATIRFIPLKSNNEFGNCIYSGKKTNLKVYFAKAY